MLALWLGMPDDKEMSTETDHWVRAPVTGPRSRPQPPGTQGPCRGQAHEPPYLRPADCDV